MSRKDALKQRYEGAVLEAMSLPELRQLRGNVIGWLETWAGGDGEAEMREIPPEYAQCLTFATQYVIIY